jgi:hypothetical protein
MGVPLPQSVKKADMKVGYLPEVCACDGGRCSLPREQIGDAIVETARRMHGKEKKGGWKRLADKIATICKT